MHSDSTLSTNASLPLKLVVGFGSAVALWVAWFFTYIPWLDGVLTEQVSVIVLVLVWLLGLTLGVTLACRGTRLNSVTTGWRTGVVSAIPGLLLIGSKVAAPTNAAGQSPGVLPSAWLITIGFVVLGGVLGLAAGMIAGVLGRSSLAREPASSQAWLARFALVTCCALAPLLFVGGLVTSTNSGMAVPDWPNTFGSNMFLYPLGPRSEPGRFLEHSHRLFGTLVGFMSIVLVIFTVNVDRRRWVWGLAGAALLLVIIQGGLGGARVTEGSRPLAMVHGVLAQLVFGTFVALSVYLSPAYIAAKETPGALSRKVRIFTTALFHSLIVQLLLGAAYRHFRQGHILYTHAAFSIIVVVAALLAGFALIGSSPQVSSLSRTLKTLGMGLIFVVCIQFGLGWAAFFVGGASVQAETIPQALIRTAHQANGALLLAFATASFLWARRLCAAKNVA